MYCYEIKTVDNREKTILFSIHSYKWVLLSIILVKFKFKNFNY